MMITVWERWRMIQVAFAKAGQEDKQGSRKKLEGGISLVYWLARLNNGIIEMEEATWTIQSKPCHTGRHNYSTPEMPIQLLLNGESAILQDNLLHSPTALSSSKCFAGIPFLSI